MKTKSNLFLNAAALAAMMLATTAALAQNAPAAAPKRPIAARIMSFGVTPAGAAVRARGPGGESLYLLPPD